MIACIIEMLELPNFADMTTTTIKFESRWTHLDFVDDMIVRNYDFITFTLKYLYFIKA